MEQQRMYGTTRERLPTESEAKAEILQEFERWRLQAGREVEKAHGTSLALLAADGAKLEEEELQAMLGGLGRIMDQLVTETTNAISYAEKMAEMLQKDVSAAALAPQPAAHLPGRK